MVNAENLDLKEKLKKTLDSISRGKSEASRLQLELEESLKRSEINLAIFL